MRMIGGRTRARLLAMTVVLAAGLSACGGSGGSSATNAATTGGTTTGASAGGDAGTAQRGGTLLVAMTDEPGLLNPLFTTEAAADVSRAMVVEPLFQPLADGTYEPFLAVDLPSTENGGISRDGRTVVYRLREGITWSDGKPFTSADVVFTHSVIADPRSTAAVASAYSLVRSVKALDPLTVEVRMSAPNPRYLELWDVVLPAHATGSTTVTTRSPQARLPLGTGPFVYADWKSGDQVTLKRNAAYWRDPALPNLDGITFKITPDRQTAVSSFVNGEFDTIFYLANSDLPDVTQAAESGDPIEVVMKEGLSYGSFLWLNHSAEGDGLEPNPVLGDPAVREAIDLAIDRQSIIDQVVDGFGEQIGSYLFTGFAAHEIEPAAFDAAAAEQVLDEAGWVPGDDGIRVKDGVRAELDFTTVSGNQSYKLVQQLIQQNLKDIGIDVKLRTDSLTKIFAGYQDGGILANRRYDLMMSLDGFYADPADYAYTFTSASIPTAESPNGFSYSHLRLPQFDRLVTSAAQTMDQEERRRLYGETAELFASERISLPLYATKWGWAWNEALHGVTTDAWDGQWANPDIASWNLQR